MIFFFFCVWLKTTNRAPAFLQSVPAWFGARRGRRRGQGDGGGGLRGVVRGQDQARAADRHLVLHRGELVVQAFVRMAPAGVGALGVDGAGAGRVRADRDVGVHGADAGVVQDEVGVVVVELAFVLRTDGEVTPPRGKQKLLLVINETLGYNTATQHLVAVTRHSGAQQGYGEKIKTKE